MSPRRLARELKSLTLEPRYQAGQRIRGATNDLLHGFGSARRVEEDLGEQWRRILGSSRDDLARLPKELGPRVLFASVWGSVTAAHAVESTLAMALKLRGAEPIVLACDEALPACEWNPHGNFQPSPGPHGPPTTPGSSRDRCRLCMLHLARSHELPGLGRASLASFSAPGDQERAFERARGVELGELRRFVHQGVAVGEHAYASLLRALLRGTLLDDARTRALATRYLAAAMLVAERGERMLRALRPDHLVAVHGVYVTQGTLCELARNRDIHVVVHGQPYRHGTIWLSHRDSYQRTLLENTDTRWQGLEMTRARRQVAEDYLAGKEFVARDHASYHVHSLTDPARIRVELGLDRRPVVTLYTNILWDAQIYYRHDVFTDMLEWLFATIRHFTQRNDVQLVVRLHPAEALAALPTCQPLAAEIRAAFPVLPANVRLVLPESRVSSYALGKLSSCALVYGARVGVELVLLGVPVIVAGEAFMRGKGFSFDPASQAEYFALLERVASLGPVPAEARARALSWYYHYFFRLMLPFPFYSANEDATLSEPRLAFSSLAELGVGRSPVLDLVCRGILDESIPFEWDVASQDTRESSFTTCG